MLGDLVDRRREPADPCEVTVGGWEAKWVPIRRRRRRCGAFYVAMVLATSTPERAHGASAARDLPGAVLPGSTITVTIQLTPPPGAAIAAAEDAPPVGWTVSNISNSGAFDALSGKVKWGLYFAPAIPAAITYDVAIPATPGPGCFVGTATFDGGSFPITGDGCAPGVPTVGGWSAIIMTLLLLAAGGVCLQRRAEMLKQGSIG